jgi:hypothetical protein
MANFQSMVITIATIILMICLFFIGISLYKNKQSYQYPPVVANCPDYWLDESTDITKKCTNVKGLGNKNCPKTFDISAPFWSSDRGFCLKKNMAKKCDITWDGVTNNNSMIC